MVTDFSKKARIARRMTKIMISSSSSPSLAVAILLIGFVLVPSQATTTSNITCGPPGSISIAGSPTVGLVAQAWATAYQQACGAKRHNISVYGGGSAVGAQRLCAAASSGGLAITDAVNVATLYRPFYNYEATTTDGYHYKCVEGRQQYNNRTAIQIDVAIDGAIIATALTGVGAECIASLPGGNGLTVPQLRWIFSNYTMKQLLATGLPTNAVPKSDGNDNTHLWSELGGSNCPATEIKISGPPGFSETFVFVSQSILADIAHGETIAMNRVTGYFNNPNDNTANLVLHLQANTDAIGFFGSVYYVTNQVANLLMAVNLKGSNEMYYAPTQSNLASQVYPLSHRVYMEIRSDDATTLAKLRPFVAFGYSQQGTTLLQTTGLIPIPFADQLLMLSRVGAPGGVNLSAIVCIFVIDPISIAGSDTVYPLAQVWSTIYSAACNFQITVSGGNSSVGALHVCSTIPPTNIGLLDRSLLASEARLIGVLSVPRALSTATKAGYDYECLIGGNVDHYVRQIPVAYDAVVMPLLRAVLPQPAFSRSVALPLTKFAGSIAATRGHSSSPMVGTPMLYPTAMATT